MKMHGCVMGFDHFGHGHRGPHHLRRGGHGPHGFGHHGHGPFGFGLHGFGHHGHGPHGFGHHGHGPYGFGHHGHGPHGHGPHCHHGHCHGHGSHGKFGHGKHGCKKHGPERGDIYEQLLAFQAETDDDNQNSACEKERDSCEERDCNEVGEKQSCGRQHMRPRWGKRHCHKMHKTVEAIRKVRNVEKQCKCGKRAGEEKSSTVQDSSAVQSTSAVTQGPSAPSTEAVAVQEVDMTSVDKPANP